MNKIHNHQLTAILFLSGAWSVICIPSLYGNGQILGTAVACLIQILCCLPMLALRTGTFSRQIQKHKSLGIIYILFFLICGANGFSQLWEAAPPQLLPSSGKLTAAVLIALTCFYTSSAGLRATARAAPLVMGIFIISLAVLILGAWNRVDMSRISFQTTNFLPSIRMYISLSGELAAVWILSDSVRNHKNTAVNSYLIAKAIFCILILFFSITAGGRLMYLNGYPFFTLTALSQPLQGQRADALYILVFVMLHIMHTTLQTGIIEHIAEQIYPIAEKWSAPVSLIFMLIPAYFFKSDILETMIFYSLPVLIFIIPLSLRIRQFMKSIQKKEYSHEVF
ncbi:MAG: hypothetical protein IJ642_08680 [Oscillospiraceae bacterium]|nr:hypothetical protein [Oscillospiraceae bacterium]